MSSEGKAIAKARLGETGEEAGGRGGGREEEGGWEEVEGRREEGAVGVRRRDKEKREGFEGNRKERESRGAERDTEE